MCQVQHYPIEEEANWVLAEEREAEYHLVLTRRRFVAGDPGYAAGDTPIISFGCAASLKCGD